MYTHTHFFYGNCRLLEEIDGSFVRIGIEDGSVRKALKSLLTPIVNTPVITPEPQRAYYSNY